MTFSSRTVLDQELLSLRDNIIRLSSAADESIERAMSALQNRDVALAHQVIVQDEVINQIRFELEEQALRILATQAPAASDLRMVIAVIHLAVELERIGDHAVGIARLVERMEDEDEIDTLHKLPKMAKRAREMVQQGIEAFLQRNQHLALDMIKRDDKIDRQYSKLFRECLEEMKDDNYIRRATFILWAGHSLERIGDRATNIAERVIFMCTGEFVETPTSLD
ncbi:MAG: phosphate signaling complex protein PhoU [Ardenticatenaceae bacterium]|nr:phosphate signaling complex protein PhoU [Anaerolineales bacterium]MCB8938811.1 phosphate signaling complex protein PhoU [Ardenticatenaceae bacterium]MCB8974047.1 phosphate signaling complex protein PhoU [Ardenticatenaceae bacterium]